MIKESCHKYTQGEMLVLIVLSVQFISFIFNIFGNPIKAGFDLGRKVEAMDVKFEKQNEIDTLFRSAIMSKIAENTASILILRSDIQDIKVKLDHITVGVKRDH
jgi:hypothetical protein